jgi:lipopolysaccharide export system protein LptC
VLPLAWIASIILLANDKALLLLYGISKAKQTGYIAKGKSSAYASLGVLVENVDPAIKFITIPAGTTFNTTSTTENKNIFHTTTDFTIKNVGGVFEHKNIIVKQGNVVKNTFLVKEAKQRLRLSDLNCDVNTIKLYVKSSENSRIRTVNKS